MRVLIFFWLLVISVLSTDAQNCACGQNINLFFNGDFETGNIAPSSTQMSVWNVNCNETFGCYDVIASTSEVGGQFNGWPHGGSQFMFVDGQDESLSGEPQTVWEQTVDCLIPGETYAFKFWLLGCSGFGDIFVLDAEVDANGVTTWLNPNTLINTMMPISSNPLNWQQYSFNWIATTEVATFRLEQINFGSGGFDFGLDDIRLIGDSGMELTGEISALDAGCDGSPGSISVTGLTGSGSYLFELMQNGVVLATNNQGVFEVAVAGDYVVRITDGLNCETALSVTVNENAQISASYSLTQPTCRNLGEISVTPVSGTPPFLLFANDQLLSDFHLDITEGFWHMVLRDANGCESDSLMIATIDQPVVADFVIEQIEPEIILLNESIHANEFVWSLNGDSVGVSSDLTLSDLVAGNWIIQLNAIDTNTGCSDSIQKIIHLKDDFNWYVPNCITPDGDGINDIFLPRCNLEKISTYHLSIYNRWGDCIFVSENPESPWYGQVHDGDYFAQDNCYVWRLAYRRRDMMGDYSLEGHVTLIR
ncbi:MAG: gliding motility-associated C-terminal domain-containing protein [Flavobacteriales bacterium]|nr:gliding motility-associated C-terminal domain-containing protein [Flavobacteriales bacterium]